MHSSKPIERSDKPDYGFLAIIVLLVGFGLVMVFSSSFYLANNDPLYFLKNQAIRIAIATGFFLIGLKVPFRFWRKMGGIFIIVSMVVLITVLFIGRTVGGATRWLQFFTFSLQPAEFVKVALLLYLANFYAKREDTKRDFKHYTLPPLLVSGILLLLIALQPNLGTATVIGILVLFVMFVAGVRLRYLLLVSVLAAGAFVLLITVFPHAKARVTGFLGNGNYQLEQARIAMGSGGLFGVGLGGGRQKFLFLPQPHTDFIFAVIGEELGFAGIAGLILLFVLFLYKGLNLAVKTDDAFGRYLGTSLVVMVFLYFLVHAGVSMGLLPTTGLPLPFISFGGSALTSNLLGIGILLNISRAKEKAYATDHRLRWNRRPYLPSTSPRS
ncbi:putative lipid II flippase FtsW [candidate division WOR-3 bacterium]|nr:putative lipid II flippase FtsW [candidate division WOR-3 bacterium]